MSIQLNERDIYVVACLNSKIVALISVTFHIGTAFSSAQFFFFYKKIIKDTNHELATIKQQIARTTILHARVLASLSCLHWTQWQL
jgi:hypothetical protein